MAKVITQQVGGIFKQRFSFVSQRWCFTWKCFDKPSIKNDGIASPWTTNRCHIKLYSNRDKWTEPLIIQDYSGSKGFCFENGEHVLTSLRMFKMQVLVFYFFLKFMIFKPRSVFLQIDKLHHEIFTLRVKKSTEFSKEEKWPSRQ